MVHVSEGLGVNLRDLIIDQKQALLLEKGRKIKLDKTTTLDDKSLY